MGIAEDILKEAGNQSKKESAIEVWIRANPKDAAVFWQVMEKGYRDAGMKFAHVIRAFRARYPDSGIPVNQSVKRFVDERFSEQG